MNGILKGRAPELKALKLALDVGYAGKQQNPAFTQRPEYPP